MVLREDLEFSPLTEMADEENLGDPRHRRIVYEHSFWKGLQAGSCLGLATSLPYHYFVKRYTSFFLLSRVTMTSALASMAGAVLSLAACKVRLYNQSPEAIFDRAYRLNHNNESNVMDQLGVTSSIVCSSMAMAIGFPYGMRPHYGNNIPPVPTDRRLVAAIMTGFSSIGLGVYFYYFFIVPIANSKTYKRYSNNYDALTRRAGGSAQLQIPNATEDVK